MERNSSTSSYKNESSRNFAFPYITQKRPSNSISASERGSAFAQPLFASKIYNAEEDPILKCMGEYLKKEKETQEEKMVLGLLGKDLAENHEHIEQNKENQEEKEMLKFIGSGMFHSQQENQIAEYEREKIEQILKIQVDDDNMSEKKFEKPVFKTPNISFLSHKNERNSEEAIRPHLGGNEFSKSPSNRSLKSFNGRPSNNSNHIEPKLEISRVLSSGPPRASAPAVKVKKIFFIPSKNLILLSKKE